MKFIKILLITFTLFSSSVVTADNHLQDTNSSNTTLQNTNSSNTVSFNKLQNPLQGNGIDSIPKLVRALLDIVLTIAVPIIAAAIIYTGFLFIAAQGNPEKLKAAKQTLMYVLIGAAILLAAYVIAETIESTVRAITG